MKTMSAKFNPSHLNVVMLGLFPWKITLKITKTELKLLTDVDMIFKCKNTTRGSVARSICHYAEANNGYLHDYDETKEIT